MRTMPQTLHQSTPTNQEGPPMAPCARKRVATMGGRMKAHDGGSFLKECHFVFMEKKKVTIV